MIKTTLLSMLKIPLKLKSHCIHINCIQTKYAINGASLYTLVLSRSPFFIFDLIRSDYRFKNPEKSITSRSRSTKNFKIFFLRKKKTEERNPWAALGSNKFPFPKRKMSKNPAKWQQFRCQSLI